MLLALDTATDRVSIALHDSDDIVITEAVDATRRHAEVLAPSIQRILDGAGIGVTDLTEIAVGVGPGAFTGLRVGIASARALAFARGIPCVGVLTLDALAHAALADGTVGLHEPFGVAIDARRREVFWAAYAEGRRVSAPQAAVPTDLAEAELAGMTVVGDAAARYPGAFPGAVQAHPSAASIARIVSERDERFAIVEPIPVYVRRPDAAEPGARKPVTPAGRP